MTAVCYPADVLVAEKAQVAILAAINSESDLQVRTLLKDVMRLLAAHAARTHADAETHLDPRATRDLAAHDIDAARRGIDWCRQSVLDVFSPPRAFVLVIDQHVDQVFAVQFGRSYIDINSFTLSRDQSVHLQFDFAATQHFRKFGFKLDSLDGDNIA